MSEYAPMRSLDEVIAGFSAEDRANITARTQQLIADEKALRLLRHIAHDSGDVVL